ncbi:MAG: WYL domain-containing protein [Nocardioides sp.]
MSTTNAGAAKDQVSRLLRLVPYLHGREQVPLDEAARVIGVPPEQLDKDLRVLFLCGLPGGYPDDLIDVDLDALEGEGVIRVSNADYLARPLRLTPTEASAIIVALRALRAGADDDTRGVVDRTLAKLEAAAAGPPLVHPGDDAPQNLALRGQVEDAVRRGRQVRITYYVPARDEESERVVDPHAVVSHHGVDYLDAWCHSAGAPRLFRLDRIHEAVVLDTPVVTDAGARRDLSAGVFGGGEDATLVTLALHPDARWVEEYYAVQAVRPRPDGGSEIDLLVGDEQWLQRLLLRLAPYAEVVSPAHYAHGAVEAVTRALALYDHPAG